MSKYSQTLDIYWRWANRVWWVRNTDRLNNNEICWLWKLRFYFSSYLSFEVRSACDWFARNKRTINFSFVQWTFLETYYVSFLFYLKHHFLLNHVVMLLICLQKLWPQCRVDQQDFHVVQYLLKFHPINHYKSSLKCK